MTALTPDQFLLFSLGESLKTGYDENVKYKILRSAKNNTQGVTWDNVETWCKTWINKAEYMQKSADEMSKAASDDAYADDDDSGPLRRTQHWNGGVKRKRPSRKLRSSCKMQKKRRGVSRRIRKSQKSQSR